MINPPLTDNKQWRLFEQRWRDKCEHPCVGNYGNCSCRQYAVTRSYYPYTKEQPDDRALAQPA